MAFFLIQGVAVALTARLDPKGWWRAVGIAATLAFNLATGTLFFASMDEVVPFYQRRLSRERFAIPSRNPCDRRRNSYPCRSAGDAVRPSLAGRGGLRRSH